jgi:anti-sigma28 factor (negative regulator of flagellin synthesis)
VSSSERKPERLDEHRAARKAARPNEDSPPSDAGEAAPEPASFEESPAVQRARLVDRLRDAVDAGDYHPDPGKTAESMLENERS